MLTTLRKKASIYGAFAAMAPKTILAYSAWVWMELFVQLITMVVFVSFWRAIYTTTDTIAGLELQQTLNYILLARIFSPLLHTSVIYYFGRLLRDGQIEIELLRPLDFQWQRYSSRLGEIVVDMLISVPVLLVAIFAFGLQLPTDPLRWLAFIVVALLGHTAVFCFDWALGCVSFYSTEIWGISLMRYSIGLFFSGLFLPLAMMPGWLQTLVNTLPFAQALYVPVALLSGITPLSDVPQLILIQLAWLVAMFVLSRYIFGIAVRKVTVQGG
jgi:ABC-2 type transport system permease protein